MGDATPKLDCHRLESPIDPTFSVDVHIHIYIYIYIQCKYIVNTYVYSYIYTYVYIYIFTSNPVSNPCLFTSKDTSSVLSFLSGRCPTSSLESRVRIPWPSGELETNGDKRVGFAEPILLMDSLAYRSMLGDRLIPERSLLWVVFVGFYQITRGFIKSPGVLSNHQGFYLPKYLDPRKVFWMQLLFDVGGLRSLAILEQKRIWYLLPNVFLVVGCVKNHITFAASQALHGDADHSKFPVNLKSGRNTVDKTHPHRYIAKRHPDTVQKKRYMCTWCIYKIYNVYIYKYIHTYIYIYTYLEPKWPLFWLEKAMFWRVDLQK